MKFFFAFFLFAVGNLLLSFLCAQEIVKIDGLHYLKDSSGNLLKIPEGSVKESPKRRPLRTGKYGTPHPSSWHADDTAAKNAANAAAVTATPTKQAVVANSNNSGAVAIDISGSKNSRQISKIAYKTFKCTVFELRDGKKTILSQSLFSMPADSAFVTSSVVVAKSKLSQIIVEIADI